MLSFRVLRGSLLCAIFAGTLCAQYRAGVQGTVTDANGSVIPDATVTLTSQETNISRKTATSGVGVYSIYGLAPGHYKLSVEKTGFSKKELADVQVGAEQMQSVNVQLELGQVTQTVTVDAGVTPLIDNETAIIGGTINNQEIQQLPSFGRDPFQLVRLAPGVFGDGSLSAGGGAASLPGSNIGGAGATDSIFKTENGVQISANGTRQNSNNIQIDGVGVNSTSWGGAAVVTPNESSVKEVKVIANNYSAENGRNSGAQVLVVSQNGTNAFHGSGFFKWHRPGLDAYQRWNGPGTPSPVQKDTNRFNQFGGGVGGPIKKNRIFAFFSYETLRNSSESVDKNWYETQQFEQSAGPAGSIARKLLSFKGEGPSFRRVIGFTCAQAGLTSTQCQDTPNGLDIGSPLTTALGTSDPTWNQAATPFGIGNGLDGVPDVVYLETVAPNINTSVQYNGRLDFQVTDKDLATFSIYWVPVDTHSFSGPARAANSWNHSSINQAWAALWNHTFSGTILNEARFNVSGWDWNEINTNPQEPWGLPDDNIDSLGTVAPQYFGAPGPSVFNQKTYNIKDTLNKVQGSHNLKFGADVSWARFLDTAPWQARPSYYFRNMWDFANDAAYHENANFDPLTGQPTAATKHLRFNIVGLFIQDDWKVKPTLTVNLGLRWENFTRLSEEHGNISNPILGFGNQALTGISIYKGNGIPKDEWNDWGPQIGFAWSPASLMGRKGFVVRGGFGIGYNLQQLAITSNGRFNPPFLTNLDLFDNQVLYAIPGDVNQFNNWPANPNAIQSFGLNGLPTSGAAVSLNGFPVNFPTTRTYRYSFDTQYDLGHNWMASVGFQGSQSRHYTRQVNLNYIFFNNLNPMVQNLSWYPNDANSHYNALLTEVQHRFAGSFEVDAQYRYSKSVDMGSQDYYTDPYPWNLKYSVGPSDFDVTHLFKLWGVWSPRFGQRNSWVDKVIGGWTISGIITLHSGFPWTPRYCNTHGNVLYNNSDYGCLYPASYAGGAGTDYSNSTFQYTSNFQKGSLAYFSIPSFPLGSLPSAPGIHRNSFRGPGYFGNDFTLSKAFGLPKIGFLGENARVVLEGNFYNLFNKLNLDPSKLQDPNLTNSQITTGDNPNPQFGLVSAALAGRIIELQAKFNF